MKPTKIDRKRERVIAPDKEKGKKKAGVRYVALCAAAIVFITMLCYLPSLHNDILKTWDDQAYVTNNDLIKDVSANGIKKIFKDDAGSYANYHPLTILSLALNYHPGVTSFPFHLTNLILHLLNTLLVFIFIFLLSEKKLVVAALTSLWFGIHPMHVESVAWISERKDVLYTFFFLLSLIAWWFYLKKNLSVKFYLAALLFFILSSLSKAMAVCLPAALLCMDYYFFNLRNTNTTEIRNTNAAAFRNSKKFVIRRLIEKIPFVIISIVLGIYAMKIQAAGGATQEIAYPFMHRVLHASYGFTMYIVKLIAPVGLSAFYPYPYPLIAGAWKISPIPLILYITFFTTVLIIATTVYFYLKKRKEIVFGMGFYFATIALVLQFLPVGRPIMADRYSYLPYIGLFFILGDNIHALLFSLNNNRRTIGKLLAGVCIVASVIFCFLTVSQIKVWKNDDSLWTNEIDNYKGDSKVVMAYSNRADYYFTEKKYDAVLKDDQTIIQLDPQFTEGYFNLGRIYETLGDEDNADKEYKKTLQLKPDHLRALHNDGVALLNLKMYSEAIECFKKGLLLNPEHEKDIAANYFQDTYYNMGVAYDAMAQPDSAIMMYKKALEIDPGYFMALNNYGVALFKKQDYAAAITYFKKATEIKPDFADAYKNAGVCYQNLKDNSNAIIYYEKALQLDPDNNDVRSNLAILKNK